MGLPTVSVIIPVYNRADVVRSSIASVLSQTFQDLELIVVDDGSTDNSVEVVKAVTDPRLRLIRHDRNRGGAAARNTGIAWAKGAWIAFQDSDDEWLPTKLSRQFSALDRHGPRAIGVYCGMIIRGSVEGSTPGSFALKYWPQTRDGVALSGDLSEALLHGDNLISTQTFMVRREALLQVGGFDTELKALQDWDCFIRVAHVGPIAFEPEPLVLQRFSENSLTKSTKNRVLAYEAILQKNQEAFTRTPKLLAERYVTLAGGLRRVGETRCAVIRAMKALRLAPLMRKVWVSLALAIVADASRRIHGAAEAMGKRLK